MTDAYDDMQAAIHALLDGLTLIQRERAYHPFDDVAARTDWAYFPRPEAGLSLAELTHRQHKLVMRLLEAGLSPEAFARAVGIMAAEDVLDILELRRGTHVRDRALYFLTLWTESPGVTPRVRGWRFQGHHISINYALGHREVISASPLFLGSNPARVQHEGFDIYRPLGDAEDVARELLHSLGPDQKAAAVVHPEAPVDMVLANLPFVTNSAAAEDLAISQFARRASSEDTLRALRFDPGRPIGIAANALSTGQRDGLGRLVRLYTARFPLGAAWERIDELDELYFAWAGSQEPGAAHYYRLQGPHLVVEYDNVQDGANHVHTVCRHPENDFGAKVLALHHATAPHP